MVVVSSSAVDNICESFTHDPPTRAQGNPTLLYLMGIHKEWIANMREFNSNFRGGQHGCARVDMDDQQYILH